MGQAVHRYLIFEAAGGFCGIAWNDAGITRFQLPTKRVEATERDLLRRVPDAKPGAPPPEVVEAVAAATRYFEGEKTDFTGFKLDLGEQDAFVRAHLRRGAADRMGPHDDLRCAGAGTRRRTGSRARCRPSDGEESSGADHPLPRVLAAGGKLGGFSAPGGSAAKRRMLELEGVHVGPPQPAQQSLGF